MKTINTAICYYYNGQLIPNTIALTTTNEENSIRGMSQGHIRAFKVLESKLGIDHTRIYRSPYLADSFKHITRDHEWESYFLTIESLQNTTGITDIFIVECKKDPIPLSQDQLIIEDYRTEYYVGFFIFIDLYGGYEDLQTLIDFYLGEGWTKDEVIETIKRFVTYDYSLQPWHYAQHFAKLRKLAQKNLELLGLESLPELIMGSDNNNSIAA